MWYVIQSRQGQEDSVSQKCRQALEAGTYREIFVPAFVCIKKYEGAWHREMKVLFPGYFFVDTENSETVRATLKPLSRIMQPVLVGDAFVPVWPEEQKFLTELMDAQHVVQMSEGTLTDGQFDIYSGPLRTKGQCLRRVDRHKRLAELEVRLLGTPRRVQVGLEIVRKQ